VTTFTGSSGDHTFTGDTPPNTLDYSGAPNAVNVNLSTGTAQNGFGGTDTIANTQIVIGSPQGGTYTAGTAGTPAGGSVSFVIKGGNNTITGNGYAVTEFSLPTLGLPFSLAAGPSADGAVWFTEVGGNNVGKITSTGVISEFPVPGPSPGPAPGGITAGPNSDGAMWFIEVRGNNIGRITTSGTLTNEFAIPSGGAVAHRITLGPDNNLWFAEAGTDKIGRITTSPDHTITEFAVPTAGGAPFDIVAGPDGNLWFTEIHSNKVGRINPSTGAVTEFTVGNHPSMITVGPDGALWFSESDVEQASNPNKIGRITTSGQFSEFSLPGTGGSPQALPQGLTAGSDGALWVVETGINKIARIATDGTVTEISVPTSNAGPFGIVEGADHSLWFGEFSANKIG
jgi:virginiamycin B lyase